MTKVVVLRREGALNRLGEDFAEQHETRLAGCDAAPARLHLFRELQGNIVVDARGRRDRRVLKRKMIGQCTQLLSRRMS